jgi:hypothetical protein
MGEALAIYELCNILIQHEETDLTLYTKDGASAFHYLVRVIPEGLKEEEMFKQVPFLSFSSQNSL